jgi:hypothetical protein
MKSILCFQRGTLVTVSSYTWSCVPVFCPEATASSTLKFGLPWYTLKWYMQLKPVKKTRQHVFCIRHKAFENHGLEARNSLDTKAQFNWTETVCNFEGKEIGWYYPAILQKEKFTNNLSLCKQAIWYRPFSALHYSRLNFIIPTSISISNLTAKLLNYP